MEIPSIREHKDKEKWNASCLCLITVCHMPRHVQGIPGENSVGRKLGGACLLLHSGGL